MCEICGKSFVQKVCLEQHTMLHTGEGLVQCEYCDKKFPTEKILEEHTR